MPTVSFVEQSSVSFVIYPSRLRGCSGDQSVSGLGEALSISDCNAPYIDASQGLQSNRCPRYQAETTSYLRQSRRDTLEGKVNVEEPYIDPPLTDDW